MTNVEANARNVRVFFRSTPSRNVNGRGAGIVGRVVMVFRILFSPKILSENLSSISTGEKTRNVTEKKWRIARIGAGTRASWGRYLHSFYADGGATNIL